MFKILATSVALSLAALGAQAATVVNGGFEDPGNPVAKATDGQLFTALATGTGNNSWSIFTALPGWTKVTGDGIEIQTNNTLTTIDGHNGSQHYVELDSNNNSSMQQTINFTSTGRYELSFFYSPRDNNVASNIISYSVAEAFSPFTQLLLDSVTGPLPPTTSVGAWTKITAEFIVKATGNHTLTFAALGTKGDRVSYGGFIDDVSIAAVPLPAGGLMLIGAIGGLALLRRRKRAA